MKLSPQGTLVWQKSLGGTDFDWAFSIITTTDGGYVVAGFTASSIPGFHGDEDFYIVKLGGSLSTPIIPPPQKITISPNPTTGIITINDTDNITIKIYNILGQIIKEERNTTSISIAEYPSGIYFIKVFDELGQIVVQNKVVKQ